MLPSATGNIKSAENSLSTHQRIAEFEGLENSGRVLLRSSSPIPKSSQSPQYTHQFSYLAGWILDMLVRASLYKI